VSRKNCLNIASGLLTMKQAGDRQWAIGENAEPSFKFPVLLSSCSATAEGG